MPGNIPCLDVAKVAVLAVSKMSCRHIKIIQWFPSTVLSPTVLKCQHLFLASGLVYYEPIH